MLCSIYLLQQQKKFQISYFLGGVLYNYSRDHNCRRSESPFRFTNPHTRQFTNPLACSGLKQLVNDPTHILGHTLDIPITRDNSDIVSNSHVEP